MWMMGYNDSGDFPFPDSFASRRLRPLAPRSLSSPPGIPSPTASCSLSRLRANDFITLNNHLAAVAEQNKREFAGNQVVVSSRWNPTPEQLQLLEELYRRGTRTPSADQIQHITAQLRKYGKIEGKNVFYWFQNHKARERQKRRRQLESAEATGGPAADSDHSSLANNMDNNTQGKDSGASRRGGEVDEQQTINLSSTHTSLNAEKSKSVQVGTNENKHEVEVLQQKRSSREKNATWSNQISSPPPHHRHIILAASDHPTSSSSSSSTGTATTLLLRPPHHPNFGFSIDPTNDYNAECRPQTLQLFPLGRGGETENGDKNTAAARNAASSRNTRNQHQFFEFLPLKN